MVENNTIYQLMAVAKLLDDVGLYEDADIIDRAIKSIANNNGLIKEAGFWKDMLGRLGGFGRRVLFKEYRDLYKFASDVQEKLEEVVAELNKKVSVARSKLKNHELEDWRTDLDAFGNIMDVKTLLTDYEVQRGKLGGALLKIKTIKEQQSEPALKQEGPVAQLPNGTKIFRFSLNSSGNLNAFVTADMNKIVMPIDVWSFVLNKYIISTEKGYMVRSKGASAQFRQLADNYYWTFSEEGNYVSLTRSAPVLTQLQEQQKVISPHPERKWPTSVMELLERSNAQKVAFEAAQVDAQKAAQEFAEARGLMEAEVDRKKKKSMEGALGEFGKRKLDAEEKAQKQKDELSDVNDKLREEMLKVNIASSRIKNIISLAVDEEDDVLEKIFGMLKS